jgi:tRNA (cmo5U34)-methyltransferase
MNPFDQKARDWDKEKGHIDRSEAIAKALVEMVPVNKKMNALEYGAGTGLLSFILKDRLAHITLMDSSAEMIRVANEKIKGSNATNMHAIYIDLEKEDFTGRFELIYNQMVLHHVSNIGLILEKFNSLLVKNGYLAIADLYTEDGSFHGEGFDGHKGFDIKNLTSALKKNGFHNISSRQCFIIKKATDKGDEKEFPVFLQVAQK